MLIVDSSLMIVDRLCGMLSELEVPGQFSKAYSYDAAMEKLSSGFFDLVLMDTQLQGKSGFELLTFIKRNFPCTKTILLTNQTGDFYREKGEEIGTDHFMDKSAEFEKAAEIIRNYSYGIQMN